MAATAAMARTARAGAGGGGRAAVARTTTKTRRRGTTCVLFLHACPVGGAPVDTGQPVSQKIKKTCAARLVVQASHSRCGCKYYRGLTTSRFAALAHGTLRPPPPIAHASSPSSAEAPSGNGSSSGCGNGGGGCGNGGEGGASGAIAGNGGNGDGDGGGGGDDDDDGRGVWDIEDLIGFAARPEGPEGDLLRRRRAGIGGGASRG